MKLSDLEVFVRLNMARKEFDKWDREFRERNLQKKPFVCWSNTPKELMEAEGDSFAETILRGLSE